METVRGIPILEIVEHEKKKKKQFYQGQIILEQTDLEV